MPVGLVEGGAGALAVELLGNLQGLGIGFDDRVQARAGLVDGGDARPRVGVEADGQQPFQPRLAGGQAEVGIVERRAQQDKLAGVGAARQRIQRLLQARHGDDLQPSRRFLGRVALGHDGALEAMLGRFFQSFLTARHRADLAAQADLTEYQQIMR